MRFKANLYVEFDADDQADAERMAESMIDESLSFDYGGLPDGSEVRTEAVALVEAEGKRYEEGRRYSTGELEGLPVLSQGQADDCHIDTGEVRVWLSRTGVEDGEPFDNTVTVERLQDGAWVEVAKYDGDSEQDASEDVAAAI